MLTADHTLSAKPRAIFLAKQFVKEGRSMELLGRLEGAFDAASKESPDTGDEFLSSVARLIKTTRSTPRPNDAARSQINARRRNDPDFAAGFDEGYRVGLDDAHALRTGAADSYLPPRRRSLLLAHGAHFLTGWFCAIEAAALQCGVTSW